MLSSAHQAIACILVLFSAAICSQAQTAPQKVATGSISGKVTIKGKAAAGVVVVASDPFAGASWMRERYRAKTDQTGSYRIANLPPGTYEVVPITPALVPPNRSPSIVVADGENVEDVNLPLVPGGVITGKITNSEGEPVIGESVTIDPVYGQVPGNMLLSRLHGPNNSTDDRGVYRIFGLPRGKYKVSVGRSGSGVASREYYRQTFYPSVTDAAKATVIEVTEGSEANNVDIVVGRPVRSFKVTGRVIDGETGRPLPNIKYGVGQRFDHGDGSSGSSSSLGGEVTNMNGEFKLENVTPGKYTIFTAPAEQSDMPAASVTFDVVDRDLTDLLIKTTKGNSLSGVMVLDGNERVPLDQLRIYATSKSTNSSFGNPPSSPVAQDGTFRITGVQSGLVGFWIFRRNDREEFEIARVERNGAPQPEAFDLGEGEQLAGFRVIVKYRKLTGAIHGQVKVENGELPPRSQMFISIFPVGVTTYTHHGPDPQLDERGRFVAEGLFAGTYRVSVYVSQPGQKTSEATQEVAVTDDTVTEVTLVLKPQGKPD